ncbi:MAG: hypothetical protein IKO88_04830 [Bacteroidales bacterium]|nr:hypothetical protein [Bacteroidales bacterium]
MKRAIFAILSIVLVCSCGGTSNKSVTKHNYLNRTVSAYSTEESGIDQKIVLNRETKEYQMYLRAVIYDGDWELSDKGHYQESIDNNTVTCELDNAMVKGEEKLGTVFRVKIYLDSRTAEFISIAGISDARDITE